MKTDPDCIFCKIIDKKIPSNIIYEDEYAFAFEDANPKAPVHIIIVPKAHISDIDSLELQDRELIGHLFYTAKRVASLKKIEKDGFRMVINNGRNAGQLVFHIHFHLLSGRRFTWPPG